MTEISQSIGDLSASIGNDVHGNVNIESSGYTSADHERILKERIQEKERDLERAHGAEKRLLLFQLDEARKRSREIERDFQFSKRLIEDLRQQLISNHELIENPAFSLSEALSALDLGDSSSAISALSAITRRSKSRDLTSVEDISSIEFSLGKNAEADFQWATARRHYEKAAKLAPNNVNYLLQAAVSCWRLGQNEKSLRFSKKAQHALELANETESAEYSRAIWFEAINYISRFDLEKGQALVTRSIDIDDRNGRGNTLEYARKINDLTLTLRSEDIFSYDETIEKIEQIGGDEHPYLIVPLVNRAVVRASSGFKEISLFDYERARYIVENHSMEMSDENATLNRSLAAYHAIFGNYDTALEHAIRSEKICTIVTGVSLSLARTIFLKSEILLLLERFDEASNESRKSAKIFKSLNNKSRYNEAISFVEALKTSKFDTIKQCKKKYSTP